MSAKMSFRDSKKGRFNKITKTLQNIISNVLGLSKSGGDSLMEVRLKAAKLKEERLHALALVAESQAVLAETEVLLAELELNEELKDLKRKSPSHDDRRNSKRLKASTETNAKAKTKSTEKWPQRSTKATQAEYRPKRSSTPKTTNLTGQKNQERQPSQHDETLVLADITPIASTEKHHRGKPTILLSNPPLRNVGKNSLGYISSKKEVVEFHRNDRRYNPLLNVPCYQTMPGKQTDLTKEVTRAKDKLKDVWQDRHLDSMMQAINQTNLCGEDVAKRLDCNKTTKEDDTSNIEIVKLEVLDDSSNSLDTLVMDLEH